MWKTTTTLLKETVLPSSTSSSDHRRTSCRARNPKKPWIWSSGPRALLLLPGKQPKTNLTLNLTTPAPLLAHLRSAIPAERASGRPGWR
jgi:hypothetical protein